VPFGLRRWRCSLIVAEAGKIEQGLAAALMNLAWAAGQIVGAGAGGAIAKATGNGVPTLAAAGLALLTLTVVSRPLRGAARRRPALRWTSSSVCRSRSPEKVSPRTHAPV
jgi:predicted MFS family arabinose efflux permease